MKYVATTPAEVFDLLQGKVTVAGAPVSMGVSTLVIYANGLIGIKGNDMAGIDPQVQLKDILSHMAGLLGIDNIEFAPPPGVLHRGFGPGEPFVQPNMFPPYHHPKDPPWSLTGPTAILGPINEKKSPPTPREPAPPNYPRSGLGQ